MLLCNFSILSFEYFLPLWIKLNSLELVVQHFAKKRSYIITKRIKSSPSSYKWFAFLTMLYFASVWLRAFSSFFYVKIEGEKVTNFECFTKYVKRTLSSYQVQHLGDTNLIRFTITEDEVFKTNFVFYGDMHEEV